MNGQKRGRSEGGREQKDEGRNRWYDEGRRQGEVDERVGRRDGKELISQQHVGSGTRKERDTRMDRRREGDKTEDGMMTTFAECVFLQRIRELK